jgi:crossover junction endodeoxyribonuclease RuvC
MIRILGLDPGIADTGWGIIEAEGNRYRHIEHGSVRTSAKEDIGKRLLLIYDRIVEIIAEMKPDSCGIEELYFAKNITSALPVAHARGVLILSLEKSGIETVSYSPPVIKQAITGTGRAEKRQVQEMVRIMLGLSKIPEPDHAADALAAAITHASYQNARERGIR